MSAHEGEGRDRRAVADRGQGTVELAMVLPLVAVLLVVVLQVGVVLRDRVMVVHAAREGARAGAVAEAGDDRAGAARRAVSSSGALPRDGTRVDASVVDGGERLRVEVRRTSRTDLPLVGALLPDVEVAATATMRIEQAHRSGR